MKFTVGSLVFKLLYSAAKASDFPTDILANSLTVKIIPNGNGGPVDVRLLQIDIAVKDDRAGTTGWYFGTYAYDHSISGSSPWLKMVPVGLMWGNDPAGLPLKESWINPSAPAYAKVHLGFEGRLNGPVDNPVSGLHELPFDGASEESRILDCGPIMRHQARQLVPQSLGEHALRTIRQRFGDLRRRSGWRGTDCGGLLAAT